MELYKDKMEMLDLMQHPAFCVEEGVIRYINPAAGHFMLTVGQSIAPLLSSSHEEYAELTDCMQLQLQLGGQLLDTTVIRKGTLDIFLPDPVSVNERFRMLALASMQLREPLAGLTAISERIFADTDPMQAALANRRLHQLLRILSNMSDVERFGHPNRCHMEYTEICGFVEEILEKADMLLEHIHVRIQHQLPQTGIYMLLDREQVERSIYNLLSNAAKFSPSDSHILVKLSQKGQRIQLSVTGRNLSNQSEQTFYDHFMREPGLEDPTQGLGLGLVLVRATAINHGGAVLIDHPEENSTRVTMTMQIRHRDSNQVHSPILRMDYTGERDHGLFELADVLPAALYRIDHS